MTWERNGTLILKYKMGVTAMSRNSCKFFQKSTLDDGSNY